MPLLCRGERLVCKDGNTECAVSVTSLVQGAPRPHATLEVVNAAGLAFRIIKPGTGSETLPLFITEAGRVVFNPPGIPTDGDAALQSSHVRIFGALHADTFVNLPRSVRDVRVDASTGATTVEWSDGVRNVTPSPLLPLVTALQAQVAQLVGHVQALQTASSGT
jgi:hypothetical protein